MSAVVRPEPGRAETTIIKPLDRVAGYQHRAHDVFRDWLSLIEATLSMRPLHEASVREHGHLADDPADVAALFTRMHETYSATDFDHFGVALGELMKHANLNIRMGEYDDMLGSIYMAWGYPNTNMGQFFTPYDLADAMAQLTVDVDELHRRLKVAIAASPLATAALMAGAMLDAEEAFAWYVARVIPYAIEHFEPITVHDPTCGSGVMLLAAASRFPSWAVQLGLVQFYGQDLDHTCVLMARTNLMLYRMNGAGRDDLLRWAERVIATPQATELSQIVTTPEAPNTSVVAALYAQLPLL